MPVDVVDRERLLEEQDAELLELAADLQREVARVALVRVDEHVDVVADLVADRAQRRDVVLDVEADLDLEGFEALVDERAGLRGRLLGRRPSTRSSSTAERGRGTRPPSSW